MDGSLTDEVHPKGYVIRRATSTDLPQVIMLNRENLPENYSWGFFRDTLVSNPESFFVAERDGDLVGYVMCRIEFGFTALGGLSLTRKGHVISIAVSREHRGRGIGRSLMVRAMEGLRGGGCSEIYLEVRVSNVPAIGLYESLGFGITKRISGYYRDGEDAYVMARKL